MVCFIISAAQVHLLGNITDGLNTFKNLSYILKCGNITTPLLRLRRGGGSGAVLRLLRLLGLDAALGRVRLLPLLDHVRDVVGCAV